MAWMISADRLRFLVNRFRERLWVKPAVMTVLSIAGAFAAKLADRTDLAAFVPSVTAGSVEKLLSVMAASMLVIATFAVASMVSAYASAGTSATPRTFPLVIADDVSQNALSTFIGAFIFSVNALVALENSYFGEAGRATLFVLTVGVFGAVILTFVRWVDSIARLGRLGTTIDKVEQAAAGALRRRQAAPNLGGCPAAAAPAAAGRAVYSATVGYVQHLDVGALQACAEQAAGRVVVAALPGTFVSPGRPLAYVSPGTTKASEEIDDRPIANAFKIGGDRVFDDDPRFGLIVLSEIAGRALSPAVNDPGTAIDIIGTLVRLLAEWGAPAAPGAEADGTPAHDRVDVPAVTMLDMFDDAFTGIARDGAAAVEVAVRLQKALRSLAAVGDADMRAAALEHSRRALARAEHAMTLPDDIAAVRAAAPQA